MGAKFEISFPRIVAKGVFHFTHNLLTYPYRGKKILLQALFLQNMTLT